MKNILFVHQSAEMYGSDKVLLYLVSGMAAHGLNPIVLLPEEGPLLLELQKCGIETQIVPVTKLDRKTLSPKGLLRLPWSLYKSIVGINRAVAGRKIDLVYSNTLAVLGAAIWALLLRKPHVWHVHEILLSPTVVRKGFPCMVRLLADKAICNSTMTSNWLLAEQPRLAKKTVVIWNGQGPRPEPNMPAAAQVRLQLGIAPDDLVVTLVGRINRWKGQALFIEAADVLRQRGFKNVHFLIVGSAVVGQENLVEDLRHKIAQSSVAAHVHILAFTHDVWSVWDASDIAVVPSTEPEPFGMVAIEAMASGKPVVVAAHGGLLDIVEDGVSGLQFEANNAGKFADAMEKLLLSADLRKQMGLAGKQRQEELFSLHSQVESTAKLLHAMTP
ncbi:glycosyltransferase family 4 protein [Rhodoferax sp.]|uniref:glycosyltransferase family 4 protein n=1 Tax=Rhodoferax sp. TaxID=50421 RepID=UPI0026266043|nr:glycosyltransferase family 4 protein [Rhodoferax sp.]MDD2808400.1 glycosyltransferase family 4 protein [Rhodoferax sp.]MDD4942906.1 glycosyltransferase family 4 protein [Rhodoferax sp.]